MAKKAETKLLKLSDIVLVRSTLAINEHLKNIGHTYKPKFFKVSNGRIKNRFKPDPIIRKRLEKTLMFCLKQYCGCIQEVSVHSIF